METDKIELGKVVNGVVDISLPNWKAFSEYISEDLQDYRTYVYRGHMKEAWELEPLLDRMLKKLGKVPSTSIYYKYLEAFKKSCRGRRGLNPPELSGDEWWALGRHFGLATPLLDWTESPFVAEFFAFQKPCERSETDFRVVYALSKNSTSIKAMQLVQQRRINQIKQMQSRDEKQDNDDSLLGNTFEESEERAFKDTLLRWVETMSHENSRLLAQAGLFTTCAPGVPIESWVGEHFSGESKNYELIRIKIPNTNREDILKNLNMMNINHASLFPDLYGASKYCNMKFEIENY